MLPVPILVGTFLMLAWLTYEDIRTNRVPNPAVGLLLLFGLIYQGMGIVDYLFHWWQSLLLFLVAGSISVALYWRHYWGAGDAKLFWAISLLLPLEQRLDFLQQPVGFLVAAYAVLFAYLAVWVAVVILRERREAFVAVMRRTFSHPWKLVLTMAYQYVGIVGFGRMVAQIVGLNLGFLQGVILTPILFYLLQYWAKKYWLLAFAPFVLVGGYFIARQSLSMNEKNLWQFAILLLLMIGRSVADIVKLTRVKIATLRPGLILEDRVQFQPDQDAVTITVQEQGSVALPMAASDEAVFQLDPGPLSPDDCQRIQQMLQDRSIVGNTQVRVRRTLPFGPAICVAYVLMWTLR